LHSNKIEGIVINNRDISNGDRFLTFLSNSGYVGNFLVKGISYSKNRNIESTSILSFSQLTVSNNYVSDIYLIEPFSYSSLENLKIALYSLKLINYFIQENQEYKYVYDYLLNIIKNKNCSLTDLKCFMVNISESEGIYDANYHIYLDRDILVIESLESSIQKYLDIKINFNSFMDYMF
jgi:recombinational DNA repair protein (RecF pathway)